MNESGSVYSKGGGGTNFEQFIQSTYVLMLTLGGQAPTIKNSTIKEVAFQVTNKGFQTDDLYVLCESPLGFHKLLFQIKTNLTFSVRNEDFENVIKDFWQDFNSQFFDKKNDRFLITKSGLNKTERNQTKVLLDWASSHSTYEDFYSEVNRIKEKEEKLAIFRSVVNDIENCNDEKLWEFLRCIELIDYDFNSTSSIDLQYVLNLINVSKSDETNLSSQDIWNRILARVTEFNPQGGSFDTDSVKHESFFSEFSPNKVLPLYKSLERIIKDSELILNPLKDDIQGFHIPRTPIELEIFEAISNYQITIIKGDPGVGKSAIIKNVLSKYLKNKSLLAFKSDLFNASQLSSVFSDLNIDATLIELFSSYSALPGKAILLDSFEKLLEGNSGNAFEQLISLIRDYPDIKLVLTSRSYAVDPLILKYGLNISEIGVVNVSPLDENEIQLIVQQFPDTKKLIDNRRLRSLIKVPKYLDYSVKLLNKEGVSVDDINLQDFKKHLWDSLIRNDSIRKNGLHLKREKAFLSVSINRAKAMKLFVDPDSQIDFEALQMLEEDNILTEHEGKFAPNHDILEDWALIRYIKDVKSNCTSLIDFFDSIGNEPAIRRSFRLWVNEELEENSEKILIMVPELIGNTTVSDYWIDEFLISIFRSDFSKSFFSKYKTDLLKDDGRFLSRCISLLTTTCKEKLWETENLERLTPIGNGWEEMVEFIHSNIETIGMAKFRVLKLILDWKIKFNTNPELTTASKSAFEITTHLYDELINPESEWTFSNENAKDIINLVLSLSSVNPEKVGNIVKEALKMINEKTYKEIGFPKLIIDSCMSSFESEQVCKELPLLVMQIANEKWKIKPVSEDTKRESRFYESDFHMIEKCWGINDKYSFFPSGIYKTPILNLLKFHFKESLTFTIDFINYAVESYVNSTNEYKHEINIIELKSAEGVVRNKFSAWELWAAFRGRSVTHYWLESVLMALEKNLLDLCGSSNKEAVNYAFDYIFNNSNNVGTTAVLASVSMAYPEIVGEKMLPLFSVKEFYEWDLSRAIQESASLSPFDDEIPRAQAVRSDLNKLPHRAQFQRGLRDFIVNIQYNYQIWNTEIFGMLDSLNESDDQSNLNWTRALVDMDARKHRLGEYDENLKGIPLVSEYDDDLKKHISNAEKSVKEFDDSMRFSMLLDKATKNDYKLPLEEWKEIYLYYNENKFNPLFDRPATLAFLGLNIFKDHISDEEVEWCIQTLENSINTVLQVTFSHSYDLNNHLNISEKDIILSSLHLLFRNSTKEKEREYKKVLYALLIAPFHAPDKKILNSYLRKILFIENNEIIDEYWKGLIVYAQFVEKNRAGSWVNDDARQRYQNAKEELIENLLDNKLTFEDINNIDFNNYASDVLTQSLLVLPFNSFNDEHKAFCNLFMDLFHINLKQKEDYSFRRKPDQPRKIDFDTRNLLEEYIVESLLYSPNDANFILSALLKPMHSKDFTINQYRDDHFRFIEGVLKSLIVKLDELISHQLNENNDELINQFWNVWKELFLHVKQMPNDHLAKVVILDIHWNSNSKHWRPLEKGMNIMNDIIEELAPKHTQSYVNFISCAGTDLFLPDGLKRFVKILKEDQGKLVILFTQPARKLVKRLFFNHVNTIKEDKELIDNYIWLLNLMVRIGSSEAYQYRENFIVYKRK